MVISITNMKGGVGKSTITQNLAVCFAHKGYTTCIVDTDFELQTSTKWAAERPDDLPSVPTYAVKNDELSKRVVALKKDFDIVIIDGTPALFELSTRAIILSDIVILPILPSIADIWTLEKFMSGYEEARSAKESMGATVKAYILLNKFNDNLNLDKEAVEVLRGFEIPVLTANLATRIAYREVMPQGRGVIEYRDKKAKDEMSDVADEIENIIKKI